MRFIKKLFVVLMVVLFTFSTGCGENVPQSTTQSYYDDDGNFVIELQGRRTVMVEEVPYSVPYNENEISLTNVLFYQNCTDYSYNLFIVILLDVSSLSESEIHWLRESDLSVKSYITNDANEYDFTPASSLGSLLLTDIDTLIFVETSSFFKENRYGFENSDLSISIAVTQEETYEYENSDGKKTDLHKTEEITYRTTIGEDIPDAETIDQPLYDYVSEWLYSKAKSYG